MPSFEVELPQLINGKVEELAEEQRAQIAKLNAEIAADNVYRALLQMQHAEDTIARIARRYDPAVEGNKEDRDLAAFDKRLKDLMLSNAYKKYLASRSIKGLI